MVRQKKEKNNVDASISAMDLDTTIDNKVHTSATIKAGDKISLNQKKETFVGVAGLWFTPKAYCHEIPANVTIDQLIQIKDLIANEILLLGDIKILPLEKDKAVLGEYWELLKREGLKVKDKKSRSVAKFRALLLRPIDRNWTAKEICKYCIEQEVKYKNRADIIKLLTDLAVNANCPDSLQEN